MFSAAVRPPVAAYSANSGGASARVGPGMRPSKIPIQQSGPLRTPPDASGILILSGKKHAISPALPRTPKPRVRISFPSSSSSSADSLGMASLSTIRTGSPLLCSFSRFPVSIRAVRLSSMPFFSMRISMFHCTAGFRRLYKRNPRAAGATAAAGRGEAARFAKPAAAVVAQKTAAAHRRQIFGRLLPHTSMPQSMQTGPCTMKLFHQGGCSRQPISVSAHSSASARLRAAIRSLPSPSCTQNSTDRFIIRSAASTDSIATPCTSLCPVHHRRKEGLSQEEKVVNKMAFSDKSKQFVPVFVCAGTGFLHKIRKGLQVRPFAPDFASKRRISPRVGKI